MIYIVGTKSDFPAVATIKRKASLQNVAVKTDVNEKRNAYTLTPNYKYIL